MSYHYNEKDFETAEKALQASVADYLAADEGGLEWRLANATKNHKEIIQAAREDGTAYYFDENGSEFWGVFEHDTDGDPCDFAQGQIEAAFYAVAHNLRAEIATEKLMGLLKAGGSLRYFYIAGGVMVHDPAGDPARGVPCSTAEFLELREAGVIEMTRREVGGYPHYANSHKSSEYRLAKVA